MRGADGEQPFSIALRSAGRVPARRPGPGPAAGLLLCVAKEVTKKGDPAEPVVCSSAA